MTCPHSSLGRFLGVQHLPGSPDLYCACGCGKPKAAGPRARYATGHYPREKRPRPARGVESRKHCGLPLRRQDYLGPQPDGDGGLLHLFNCRNCGSTVTGHPPRTGPRRFRTNYARGADHPSWKGGSHISLGYVMATMKDHPRANSHGFVREHILIAEKALGKPLPSGAEVHHVNEIKNDNRNANLVVCQDRTYHWLLHMRQRALDACGDPNWLKCPRCKQYDAPEKFGTNRYHIGCEARREYDRIRRNRAKLPRA